MYRIISLVVILFASASLSLAAMTICQGCGWEVDASLAACSHCSTALEKKAAPVEQEQKGGPEGPESKTPAAGSVDDSVVDAEVGLARKYIKAGDHELGEMFLKNAAILNAISSSSEDGARSSGIARMLAEFDGRGLLIRSKCLSCGGTGKRTMTISSLIPGAATSREVQGSKCLTCKGAGIVRRPGNMDERTFAMGRAEGRFSTLQKGRKYQRIGGAWLPRSAAEALGVKQTALVREASSSPCEECQGFGKIDCKACEARGTLDCRACEDGNVLIKVKAELTKMTLSRSEKCKECTGRGVLRCEKCGGSGGVLCRKCNGNGERPQCRKCGGHGYTECRKCSSTGKIDGESCEYCRSEGALLCTSCKGDGRK